MQDAAPKRNRSYSRLKDLKARGIVTSYDDLVGLIEQHGFPPGYKLSHKNLIFDDDEVDAWIATKRRVA
jgi:hypothetical protein